MYFHFMIGKALPRCPMQWGWDKYISYPSVSFMFCIMTIVSFVFAMVVGFKYNSVRVFNRKIRTQNISNTMWILYYSALAFRGVCNTLRYALEERHEESLDSIFFLAALILHGITAFALSLALNHQRKYRSSIPLPSAQAPKKETDPLLAKYSWCRRTITAVETSFFFMFVIYLIFLYLQIMKSDDKVYEYLFLAAFALQRIPVIVLVFLICIGRANSGLQSGDGPTRQSRVYLGIAAFLNIAGDLPLTIWNSIFADGCVFVVASWVDFVHLLYIVSLVFFFLFLRSEYLRNMEECIWTTVSQIQDTFDFRRF